MWHLDPPNLDWIVANAHLPARKRPQALWQACFLCCDTLLAFEIASPGCVFDFVQQPLLLKYILHWDERLNGNANCVTDESTRRDVWLATAQQGPPDSDTVLFSYPHHPQKDNNGRKKEALGQQTIGESPE